MIANNLVTKYIDSMIELKDDFKEKIIDLVLEQKEILNKINDDLIPLLLGYGVDDIVLSEVGEILLVKEIDNFNEKIFDFNYSYGNLTFGKNDLTVNNWVSKIYTNCCILKNTGFSNKSNKFLSGDIIYNFGNVKLKNRKDILNIKRESITIFEEYKIKNKEKIDLKLARWEKEHERYTRNHPDLTKTYLMKNKRNGLYKIGKSTNPKARERTLQSQEPETEFVKIWDNDIEKTIQNHYEKQRVRGEWFDLTKTQIQYICKKDWML